MHVINELALRNPLTHPTLMGTKKPTPLFYGGYVNIPTAGSSLQTSNILHMKKWIPTKFFEMESQSKMNADKYVEYKTKGSYFIIKKSNQ